MNNKSSCAVILFAASLLCYFNALSNGFVFDDAIQILNNPWIRDIRHLPDIMFSNVWAFIGEGNAFYYRPLVHLLYLLGFYIFGLKAWGFHLLNIIIHAGVSITVFLIAAEFSSQRQALKGNTETSLLPAFLAALLFALHPVHTEAVTYLSGEPVFSLFYLLAFYLYMRSERVTDRYYALSLAAFFIALIGKETAVTLPLALFAYDLVFKRKPFSGVILRYLPFAVVIAAYGALRVYSVGVSVQKHTDFSAFELVLNVFPLFAAYIGKLLWPLGLKAFYVFKPVSSILEARAFLSLAATLLVAIAGFIFRKDKAFLFGLALIVIPLVPALYIPSLGQNTFTERYLYLPSAGFALILMSILERASTGKALNAKYAVVAALAVAVAYSGLTINRNYDWKSNETLWKSLAEEEPSNYYARFMLGFTYLETNRPEPALSETTESIRLLSTLKVKDEYTLGKAYYNIGVAHYTLRHYDDAILAYNESARFMKGRNSLCNLANNLGNAYAQKGLLNEARASYETALSINPSSELAMRNLQVIELRLKNSPPKTM